MKYAALIIGSLLVQSAHGQGCCQNGQCQSCNQFQDCQQCQSPQSCNQSFRPRIIFRAVPPAPPQQNQDWQSVPPMQTSDQPAPLPALPSPPPVQTPPMPPMPGPVGPQGPAGPPGKDAACDCGPKWTEINAQVLTLQNDMKDCKTTVNNLVNVVNELKDKPANIKPFYIRVRNPKSGAVTEYAEVNQGQYVTIDLEPTSEPALVAPK